jgi:hypothetical protein
MTRGGLARHLSTCPERAKVMAAAAARGGRKENLYHLQVQDARGGNYWLHLEMRGGATLADLDDYLRAIWLECCGHMSMFSSGGWGTEEIEMDMRADKIFKPGEVFIHIYDFGTESQTLIRVKGVRQGWPTTQYPIALMGRNRPPEITCQECDNQASALCLECVYEYDEPGTLCTTHAAEHPHDDYGEPLPLVNSPRVGLCGYVGPAEPPY